MTPPIVILSPHLDDAVLSCWHLIDGPDDVRVVNVFTGVPPAGVDAGWWDAAGGHRDSGQIVKERIDEDRAALALAGRGPVNLGFLDNQYRSGPQAVEPLVGSLREVLPRDALLYAPGALAPMPDRIVAEGAGRVSHPDHVAVRTAALALRAEGYALALYADLPHASVRGWPEWVASDGDSARSRGAADLWSAALTATGLAPEELVPEVRQLAPESFDRKARAVRRYASQVATIERAFGRRLDDPALLGYEVVWSLPAAAAAA